MDESKRAVPQLDRLAWLLGDERGTEILAELQKIFLLSRPPQQQGSPGPEKHSPAPINDIGIWDIVDTGDGPSLRRQNRDPGELRMWADVGEVPGKGAARRVVLVGESSARGFLLDPTITPSRALEIDLRQWAGAGIYQCVDLAHTGASLEDITQLLGRVSRINPDIVVLYAGNNWSLPRYSVAQLDASSRLLRNGGYAAMRAAFWPIVVLPRAQLLLAKIEDLLCQGVEVIIVIPEFNLREWCPPAGIEVPVLPPDAFVAWHELREQAEIALRARQWDAIPPLTQRMQLLDEGCSPVTGHLLGRALEALGNGRGARRAYEDSRDSVCGLLIGYTPRIIRSAQELLVKFCEQHSLAYVDLREHLAAEDLPELPDPRHFLDYCHLSESGIDAAMSAVGTAIRHSRSITGAIDLRGRGSSSADLSSFARAASHLTAACYNACCGQPQPVLRRHLQMAVAIWPESIQLMEALLDLLEGVGPLWANSQFYRLAKLPHVARYLETLVARRSESLGLWALQMSLAELIPIRNPPRSSGRNGWVELLEVPQGGLGVGHMAPNFTAGRCYLQSTSSVSHLYFPLQSACSMEMELTYRMTMRGSDGVAHVEVNGTLIGDLAFARQWSSARLLIDVAASGVNQIAIRWPIGILDYCGRRDADAATLARGDYPYVLPVFGEIFSARLRSA
jgi:hypothetical protein